MQKIFLFLGIIILVSNISAYAASTSRDDTKIHDLTSEQLERSIDDINAKIETLYKNANNDPYLLSIPLLISAQLGDKKMYKQILVSMQTALNDIPDNTDNQNAYKAWLLGRVLLAANNMGDTVTTNSTKIALFNLLTNHKTAQDAFSAWGWGYYAASGKLEYKQSKSAMLRSAKLLDEQYRQTLTTAKIQIDDKAGENLQSQRSNALWAWVMALQAASTAKDKETYQMILENITSMMNQQNVAAALNAGLLRLSVSNDYPAWALSIVSHAAVNINDMQLYQQISPILARSLQQANQANAEAEVLLAQSNNEAS